MLPIKGGTELITLDSMNKKINWLESSGFKYEHCKIRRIGTWNYKGYSWTLEDIKEIPLEVIKTFKDWYDEKISEKDLQKIIDRYKTE